MHNGGMWRGTVCTRGMWRGIECTMGGCGGEQDAQWGDVKENRLSIMNGCGVVSGKVNTG